MIKKLVAKVKRLSRPLNYFSGMKHGVLQGLPENLLVFQRGDVAVNPMSGYQHHRFLLSVNLGETCELILDGVRFSMRQGSALLVYPNQQHIFIHDHPGIMRLMVSFEMDSKSALLPPKDKLFLVEAKELSILSMLLGYYLEEKDGLSCSLLLSLLLRQFKGQPQMPSELRKLDMIDSVVLHIQSHMDKTLSIQKLAALFNVSASNLRLRFRKALGVSLGRYIADSRLNRARGYLGECDMKIEEIAARCGYHSLSAFGHAFYNRVGMSPLRYRQKTKSQGLR